jgi:hypothetical protein
MLPRKEMTVAKQQGERGGGHRAGTASVQQNYHPAVGAHGCDPENGVHYSCFGTGDDHACGWHGGHCQGCCATRETPFEADDIPPAWKKPPHERTEPDWAVCRATPSGHF